jgi:hypothetical protein
VGPGSDPVSAFIRTITIIATVSGLELLPVRLHLWVLLQELWLRLASLWLLDLRPGHDACHDSR